MPEKTAQHWTESLFDSVYALYETAREYQNAHRAAQTAVQTVDIDRRKIHEGRVAIEGRTNAYGQTVTREPHADALFGLRTLYDRAESELHGRYKAAALLYAGGAAWAIAMVQAGNHPPVVTYQSDGDAVQHQLHISGLDRYAGGKELDAAYDVLVRCTDASEFAEDLAGRDYVSDHEAGQMFRAIDASDGLADAAYAYGLLAQRALNFVLLEPRRARERELAAARAAQQTSQSAN